jgi:hypothetical protein
MLNSINRRGAEPQRKQKPPVFHLLLRARAVYMLLLTSVNSWRYQLALFAVFTLFDFFKFSIDNIVS